MIPLELEFETNANGTGTQIFRQLQKGVTLKGKPVYLYQRVFSKGKRTGETFGFEVVIPSVKKAGVYDLPLDKKAPVGTPVPTITYAEDFEEYPGAAKFGFSAWSYPAYQQGGAQWRFKTLTEIPIDIPEVEDDIENIEDSIPVAPKTRGRPKAERPPITLPEGEFSKTEVAQKNGVAYIVAHTFIEEQVAAGVVKVGRKERRAARGKETQLYFT